MEAGHFVGPYRVLRHIGSGGMGAVWLAEDTRLHRQVALKMVRAADTAADESRLRLMREARAAAALNHPHIAAVHDVIETDGEVVIVFEFVEGETLHSVLRRGPLPPAAAVDIATQIAGALVHAHGHGIVHRDLKPANVIVGAGGDVKVLDFGIARVLALGTTATAGSVPQTDAIGFIGTAAYAAPEQMVSSAVDERADLYALGVMLFEMISGTLPFPGNDPVQLASSKLSKDPPSLASTGHLVPPALERFVASLLQRDREDRPASAREAAARLREISGTPGTGVLSAAARGGFWISAAAVIIIAAVAGFGAWELNRFVRPVVRDPSAPPVIAVMPLTNVSGDPSRDYVAAGIAESLISSLASLPAVTVLSRASVTEARSRAHDEAALARDLGATYVVNGSVQEANGTLKISLNLVKPDRTIAWGHSVDGAFERIFELQSQLATALSNALVIRVSASERQRMNAQPTTSPEALSRYWQGSAMLDRIDPGNADAAIAAFQDALAIDPKFALAHAGLGQAYRRKYVETFEQTWAQRAIDEATIALTLDPERAEVRYVLALTLAGGGRLDDAAAELRRALALRPNYEDAHRQLGAVLAEQQQIDAAVEEFQRAIALRPASPLGYNAMGMALYAASRYAQAAVAFEALVKVAPDSSLSYSQLGTVYHAMGRFDDALANYRKAIAIRPSLQAHSNIGALLHQRGDFEGAVKAYREALTIRPNSIVAHRNLGDALLRLGRRREAKAAYLNAVKYAQASLMVNPADTRTLSALAVYLQKSEQPGVARKRMAEALSRAPNNAEVLFRAGVVYALAGDRDRALGYLERAAANGYSKETIRLDDDLVVLREDPRFKQLTRE